MAEISFYNIELFPAIAHCALCIVHCFLLAARAFFSRPLSPYGQRNTPVPLCHFVTFPPYYGGNRPPKGGAENQKNFSASLLGGLLLPASLNLTRDCALRIANCALKKPPSGGFFTVLFLLSVSRPCRRRQGDNNIRVCGTRCAVSIFPQAPWQCSLC